MAKQSYKFSRSWPGDDLEQGNLLGVVCFAERIREILTTRVPAFDTDVSPTPLKHGPELSRL